MLQVLQEHKIKRFVILLKESRIWQFLFFFHYVYFPDFADHIILTLFKNYKGKTWQMELSQNKLRIGLSFMAIIICLSCVPFGIIIVRLVNRLKYVLTKKTWLLSYLKNQNTLFAKIVWYESSHIFH